MAALSDLLEIQPVEVAISIDFQGFLVFFEQERRFRFLIRMQLFGVESFIRLQIDPFDVVSLRHRMKGRSNLDEDAVILNLHFGNMLFEGAVSFVGDEFLHHFPAARRGGSRFVQFGDQAVAMEATVEFHVFILSSDFSDRHPNFSIDGQLS